MSDIWPDEVSVTDAAIALLASIDMEKFKVFAENEPTLSFAPSQAMRLAEQYITAFGNLAKTTNTVLMPANVADVAGMIGAAMVIEGESF